jgi:hypothetical protein
MAPFEQKRALAVAKHAGGRPSEYRPEYCDLVIEKMAEGYSLTAFAGFIRMSKEAVYKWMTVHSEFADAVSRARPARVTALEAKLLRSRKGAETTAAMFALRNADPAEWRDVRNVQHDHAHRVETLTDAQLFAIASGKALGDSDVIDADFERVATS